MKSKAFLLVTLLALLGLAPRPAEARVEVSFDFFYDGLSPYGEWLEVGDYGPCWRPRGVDADWRPYADGYWTYTDGGWTWVSYEEFGGIVYHYGRWAEVDGEGWCWVPDYEWAPAWVSWRSSDDYIGWAPLPPEAHWRRDTGFSVWVDAHFDIGPARFNFCRVRDFGAPYLRPVIVNRFENVVIIQRTANCTNISYYDDHDFGGIVHCGGPSFAYINQHAYRPIPALKLVHKTNITNINIRNVNIFNAEARGNQLAVAAPRIVKPVKDAPPPKLVRSIPAARVTKGWAGVNDPDGAEGIRTKLRQESRGLTPESAPARRVQTADLKVVPTKADPNAPSTVRTTKERGSSPGKKPASVTGTSPEKGKPDAQKPVDARTAERMLRDQAREPKGEKPGTEPPAAPRTVAKPSVPEKAEPREAEKLEKMKTGNGRQATRSIPPAVVAPPPAVEKKPSTPLERAPVAKSKPSGDDEAKARAAAAARERSAAEMKARASENAARERAAAEAKARSAAIERQRAAEDAARKQNAARDMQRRQAIEQPRREAPVEMKRSKPDDSAQRAAAQAAARQQAAENARRAEAQESARRSQMEAARREQAVQAARQQQQATAARQRVEVQRQAPPPAVPRGTGSSGGKKELSKEEMEALKKARGR
jgi:hypothetical protein